jgi:hypothetical protein
VTAERAIAWVLLLVFGVWAFAFEGFLAERIGLGSWTPHVGLALALAVLARSEAHHLVGLVVVFALARTAVGGEPPLVLVAGFACVFFGALLARGTLELSSAPWRTLLAFVVVLAFDAWLGIAARVRHPGGATVDLVAWRAALTTACFAWLVGPLLVHLPGLTPLRTRRW